jgi:anti-sigma B factor antagonist
MDLTVTTAALDERRCTVVLHGRLNAVSAPELKARLKQLLQGGSAQLIVDLSGVAFVDSSGLSALISGLKSAREAGGYLKLAGLNEQVGSIFRLTRLDRVFEMYPDVDAALKS